MRIWRALLVSLAFHSGILALIVLSHRRPASEVREEKLLGDVFVPGPPSAEPATPLAAPTPAPGLTAPAESAPGNSGGAASGDPAGAAEPRDAIAPIYPPVSRQLGEEGTVIFSLVLRADGSVETVDVLQSSGYARLDEAGRKALHDAHFRLSGNSSPLTKTFTMEFRLKDQRPQPR